MCSFLSFHLTTSFQWLLQRSEYSTVMQVIVSLLWANTLSPVDTDDTADRALICTLAHICLSLTGGW